jgi:hypothetical protein
VDKADWVMLAVGLAAIAVTLAAIAFARGAARPAWVALVAGLLLALLAVVTAIWPALPPPQPEPTPSAIPTSTPSPTSRPSPSQVPRRVGYEENIPPDRITEQDLKVDQGTILAWIGGPYCVESICLEGGAEMKRANVVVLLPRSQPYYLWGLVPMFNSLTTYDAGHDLWESIATERTNSMFGPTNCGGNACQQVGVVVIDDTGVIRNEVVRRPS